MPASRFAEFDRIHDKTVLGTIRAISKLYKEAETVLSAYQQRAIAAKDEEAERNAFWMRIAVAEMTGRGARAEELLSMQHQKYPDLRSKLAIVQHLTTHRRQYREALTVIARAKLPRNADGGEITNFYNLLVQRGYAEVGLERWNAAARTMKRLADFTVKYIDSIQFFFDVHLVAVLANNGIARKDSRRYLEAIATRDQVTHDAQTTRQLLRKLGSTKRVKVFKHRADS